MTEKVKYDDNLIAQIDKDMGWIEEDGSSPSRTAKKLGYHCKFMKGPFSDTAWYGDENRVWSVCLLSGNKTTLLAKSFSSLESLHKKNRERPTSERWMKYYSDMWNRRYKKWYCKSPAECDCYFCRK